MTRSCLANIEYGAALAAALRQRAVIVRHFAAPRISDYLRITVGRCCMLGEGGCEDRRHHDRLPGLPAPQGTCSTGHTWVGDKLLQ
jgi:hypothetical protein